jgi:hypothetical protein
MSKAPKPKYDNGSGEKPFSWLVGKSEDDVLKAFEQAGQPEQTTIFPEFRIYQPAKNSKRN